MTKKPEGLITWFLSHKFNDLKAKNQFTQSHSIFRR